MTLPKTMYPGMVNSPETTITNNINESDTIIYVLDPARVPEPPNLMTLGTGTNAETVKVTEINDSAITVERGIQGVAKSWSAGTIIARNFTEYDYRALVENIEALETSKETPAGAQVKANAALAAANAYTDQEVGEVAADLAAHLAEKATQTALGHIKLQESWKVATLLNGWTGTLLYAKNDLGVVTIKADIIAGVTTEYTQIAQLDTPYIPLVATPIILHNASTAELGIFYLNISGAFNVANSTLKPVDGTNYRGIVQYFVG